MLPLLCNYLCAMLPPLRFFFCGSGVAGSGREICDLSCNLACQAWKVGLEVDGKSGTGGYLSIDADQALHLKTGL